MACRSGDELGEIGRHGAGGRHEKGAVGLVEVVAEPTGMRPHPVLVRVLQQLRGEITPEGDLGLGDVAGVEEVPAEDGGGLLELEEVGAGGLPAGVEKADGAEHLAPRPGNGHPAVDVEGRHRVGGDLGQGPSLASSVGGPVGRLGAVRSNDLPGRVLDDHGHARVLLQHPARCRARPGRCRRRR